MLIPKTTRQNEHAELVLSRLRENLSRLRETAFDVGRDLAVIKTKRYFILWGYSSFGKWLRAEGQDLGICYTQGYWLTKFAEKVVGAGVSIEDARRLPNLAARSITKLRDPEAIRSLVKDVLTGKRSSSEVARTSGFRAAAFSFSLTKAEDRLVVLQALRAAKANRRIPDSAAFLAICEAYLEFCYNKTTGGQLRCL